MLDLNNLVQGRIRRISQAFSVVLAEAAGFCLESQAHEQGTKLLVRGSLEGTRKVAWPRVDSEALQTYDPEQATELGATGIAVLLAVYEIGFRAIERSRKGTGIDYWLGDESDQLPFQRRARLEVSGIRKGDDSTVKARVRQKLRQSERSDRTRLPAYIIVVDFGGPLAEVRVR